MLIVDDVITAGTAIREALGLIHGGGGKPAGIVVALDRQEVLGEPGASGPRQSAAQSVATETGVSVVAVANLHDLLAFAGESAELVTHRDRLLAYRASYGSGPTAVSYTHLDVYKRQPQTQGQVVDILRRQGAGNRVRYRNSKQGWQGHYGMGTDPVRKASTIGLWQDLCRRHYPCHFLLRIQAVVIRPNHISRHQWTGG